AERAGGRGLEQPLLLQPRPARLRLRARGGLPRFSGLAAQWHGTCPPLMPGPPLGLPGGGLGNNHGAFGPIENYRDLESINAYHDLTARGVFQPEELLEAIAYKSRDNARTPFQWDDSPNAGFTTGEPWIMVNPNYREINAKEQLDRAD